MKTHQWSVYVGIKYIVEIVLSISIFASMSACTGVKTSMSEPGGQMVATPVSEEGVINSSGSVLNPGQGGDNNPGMTAGSAPEDQPQPAPQSVNWQVYQDEKYPFSFKFPDVYVRLPDAPPQNGANYEARFLDKQLSQSDTAAIQPPNISVQVFEGPLASPLADWLGEKHFLPGGAEISPVDLKGALEAVEVKTPLLLAPNSVRYYKTAKAVYRLAVMGQYSQEVLDTFQISAD